MKNKKSVQVSGVMKSEPSTSSNDSISVLQALFGPPPLLEGEDPEAYNRLLDRVTATVKPTDVFEEIWVFDIVHLTWEVVRYRRLKVDLIKANTDIGIRIVLGPQQSEPGEAYTVSKNWLAGRPAAIKKVNEWLGSAKLSMNVVSAVTVGAKISEIERIDRLAMNAEIRRNAALREIERHRATFGKALRSATDEVVDAEFEPVEAPQIENKKAA